MSFEHVFADALRVAVLLGIALASMPALRRASSATRRLVLAVALGGALVLPVLSAVAPAWQVEAPAAVASLRARVIGEPAVLGPALVPPGEAAIAPAPSVIAGPSALGRAQLVALGWASGALLVIARLAMGLLKSRAMVKRAIEARSWSIAIARAESTMGLRADVRVSDDVGAPAVTGIVSPVVLVPQAAEEWSDDRRYAVLLHELAHVRQRDCLVQIVGQLACAVHWFNPLAWLAVRRFKIERELAADDAVVTAGARASSYAEDLLAIAGADRARAVPAGALGMAERSQLAVRVRAIVSTDRARRPLGRVRSVVFVTGAGCLILGVACAKPAPSKNDPVAPVAKSAPPVTGSTIDPRLQAIADRELDRAVKEWGAAAGAALVRDPSTGAILANAGRAHGVPSDVAIRGAYVTGSTLKAITLAGALEDGVITPTDRFDCENGAWTYQGQVMHDAAPNGTLSIPEMLAVSSNIGFTKVFDRLGGARLDHWLHAFHFGAAPAIEGANAGELPARIEEKSYAGAVVAIGESATASPLQLAAAYATFANDGAYVAPTLTRRADKAPREQVIKVATARTVVAMLDEAVNGERATGKLARVAGARVAGKTGTAGWTLPNGEDGTYASFVGIVPSTAPRFVILVGIEQPKDGESGGKVAAPVFARIATAALAN